MSAAHNNVRRRQPAQTIALAAVVMLAVLGLVAVVVDVGIQFETRRELQNTADAAALAGVSRLPTPYPDPAVAPKPGKCDSESSDSCNARDLASKFAVANASSGFAGVFCQSASPQDAGALDLGHGKVYAVIEAWQQPYKNGSLPALTVTMECTTQFTMGQVLGLQGMQVRASAVAVKGSAGTSKCALPFAFENTQPVTGVAPFGYTFGQRVAFKVDDKTSGNSHAIFLNPADKGSDWYDELAQPCSSDQSVSVGETRDTNPGTMSSNQQVKALEKSVLESCSGNSNPLCKKTFTDPSDPKQSYSYDAACRDSLNNVVGGPPDYMVKVESPCLVTAAIVPYGVFADVDSYDHVSGKKPVQVTGFGMFFVEGYSGTQLFGYFVRAAMDSDIAPLTDYGSQVIRLIR
jgi:hypothetical protein